MRAVKAAVEGETLTFLLCVGMKQVEFQSGAGWATKLLRRCASSSPSRARCASSCAFFCCEKDSPRRWNGCGTVAGRCCPPVPMPPVLARTPLGAGLALNGRCTSLSSWLTLNTLLRFETEMLGDWGTVQLRGLTALLTPLAPRAL